MFSKSKLTTYAAYLSLCLASISIAEGNEVVQSNYDLNSMQNCCNRTLGCRDQVKHGKCKKRTIFTANYQTWNDVTVIGTGTINQEVANITQGTKITLPPISFSSATTEITFTTPSISIPARYGDTIFVDVSFSLDADSSITSTQPFLVSTSDTKNFSSPQNLALITPDFTTSNTSSARIDRDNFTFVTVFFNIP